MFRWFSKRNDMEEVKEDTKKSFEHVKDDIEKIGGWINHLDNDNAFLNTQISDLKQDVSSIRDEIEQLKDVLSIVGDGVSKQLFKTNRQQIDKQTADQSVYTPVQTPVQTGNLYGFSNLSVTERAIILVLANSDMKLSYDDLAAMLGKTRSTIRGQINSIKQKSEGLILEYSEQTGKKRVYIPDEIKEKLAKSVRLRIRKERKDQRGQ
ncbi:MAG: helix-turn-helix transcriptional regulator [Candidatus Pacearchaeota archaeon]|jgi:biotin operon repressor